MKTPHRAYVGPEAHWDISGAVQFVYLIGLGLRANHRLLDFGAGALKAGQHFLLYLNPGNYYAIEPNAAVFTLGLNNEINPALWKSKQGHILDDSDCRVRYDVRFDFILAQSIFTHCGLPCIKQTLEEFESHLLGSVVASFFIGAKDDPRDGWHEDYPERYDYKADTIMSLAAEVGLKGEWKDWFHPEGQTWAVFERG